MSKCHCGENHQIECGPDCACREPEAAPVAERTEQQRATDAIEEAVRDAVNGRVILAGGTVDAIVATVTPRILALRSPDYLLERLDRMSDEEIVEFADISAAVENREYNALTVHERETSGIRFRAKHERRHFRALLSRLRKEDV